MPLRDEFFELKVGDFGQHDVQRDISIAIASFRGRDTLSFEAKNAPGIGAFRNCHQHRAGWRWHIDLPALDRLDDRDRQVQMDIVAFAREQPMDTNVDLDQGIARWPASVGRQTFPAQPQGLGVPSARRYHDVERRAIRQRYQPFATIDRLEEIQLQSIQHVRAWGCAIASAGSRKQLGEQAFGIFRFAEIGKSVVSGIGMRGGVALRKVAIKRLMLSLRSGRIDFTTIETGPLLQVAQKTVGSGNFLELFFGTFVPGVQVWMQFFGKLAVRLLELVGRDGFLDAQHLIGIRAHDRLPSRRPRTSCRIALPVVSRP